MGYESLDDIFNLFREVIREVKIRLSTAGQYQGYFINVTGSIPYNVPLENLEAYSKACRK